MEVIWNGFLYGLLLCVLIGPVFFALIQNSIERGFRSGLFMAMGIALSDSFYIFVAYFGISRFVDNPAFNIWLGGVGGLIMLGFGVGSILKPVPVEGVRRFHNEGTAWFRQILKGFFLNGVNPFLLFFWIGITSKIALDFSFTPNETLLFFATLIATVFGTDLIKSHFAVKLSQIVTPRFMKIMNRLVGFVLIGFGFYLFNYVLESLGCSILGYFS